MKRCIPPILQWDENFDIGANGIPVYGHTYTVWFRFTGKLDKLSIALARRCQKLGDAEDNRARE